MPEEDKDLSIISEEDIAAPMDKDRMLAIVEMDLTDHPVQNMSLQAKRRLRASILKLRTGVQSIVPAVCPGAVKCPFRHKCPIVDRSIKQPGERNVDYHMQKSEEFPIGEECIVERTLLNIKRRDYMVEYDVDPESPTEIGMANKLAELDLLEMRVSILLSAGDDKEEGVNLLKNQVVGVDENGTPHTKLEIHPAWELKEKIQRQRDNVLQAMVGTRREQYKRDAALKQSNNDDPGSNMARIKAVLEKARQDPQDHDVVDAEFTENKE